MAITPKHLAACALSAACALAAALAAPASAATEPASHPKATKVLKDQARSRAKADEHKKKKSKKEAPAPVVADEPEPDITDTVVAEYACEMNNKVTIYTNEKDDGHIALRWNNRLHRLDRVGTTTGAMRFENPKFGLIWIGIPSKGILLDSKLNRQLANECKKPEPAPQMAVAPVEKKEG